MMKTMKWIAPMLPAVISVLISCSKSTDYTTPAVTDTSIHKISILASAFDPPLLYMQAGSRVTWTNSDSIAHSIVADDGISFISGTINPGNSYSTGFLAPGVFAYHCGIHPAVKGVVNVINKQ